MATKILQATFPHMHTRSSSSTDVSKTPKSGSKSGSNSPTKSGTNSPAPQRPQPVRAASHPGPAPKVKQPGRAFGTNYRVRRTPPGSPPNERVQSQTQPLGPAQAQSSVRDFAKITSSAAHSQPSRRKPVYSMHEADPAVKGRPEVMYTDEELLKRLNTIGEDEETDIDRVKTVEREKEREWEEERRRKEDREMEEWNRKEAKKAQSRMVRGFSWKGVKKTVGGFR
ncbi:hypothetical protein SLS60_007012 [Paraconiothyrium brasiliense]|uniref:Uncharacterized protein n=1 Tax=Paraconiothyrium brasiliense TaxID=300254 RepID=A0ABR3R881_9PLEO